MVKLPLRGLSSCKATMAVSSSCSIVAVLLAIGISWWLCRRRRSKRTAGSSSFEASYAVGPFTVPAANPITLESYTPAAATAIRDLDCIDRTVDLDSTVNLDSTIRLENSATLIPTKKSSKSNSSLSEDESITAARIPLEKLLRKELINEGGHGAVYKGLYRDEDVAIKVLLPEKRKDMCQINLFLAEIKMMASVEHPRIVRFVGVAWDALSDLCAVSEFMPGGDLFTLLRRFDRVEHRDQGFDIDKATIALHVAQALTYLHSLDPIVLHRDLKSMNILLSEELEAKLTDFGVSRKFTVNTMTAGVGTRRWMAPEVMMGKRYNTSADIFSFGVVLSELDSHQPPYASAIATMTAEAGEKVSETALMEMVAMGRVRVDFSANAPTALVELGHACVAVDPTSRPSAANVHYHLQKLLRKYQQYTL
uniref:Protein kinase domain-containing protein n=1 Tax=Hyaloperonospora arabidopsidis (strain Emoy2) TaxID=559515 RepID=M4C5C0_HYAAE